MSTAIELRKRDRALNNPAFDNADLDKLQGATKAFLFLISLEEEVATRIISHLDDGELKLIRRASEETREVSSQTLLALHREFALRAKSGAPTSLKGGSAYLRRLAGKALGDRRAYDLWTERRPSGGLVAELEKLPAPALLGLLDDEGPQTLALILSQFDPTKAADVLAQLSKEQRGEILYRMATLEAVPETTFKEIEAELAGELAALADQPEKRAVGGVETTAAVMKRLKPEHLDGLLDQMNDADAQITDLLKRAMFTFEDLLRISGRGIQVLLKEIPSDQLLLALRTASDDMKEKIFGNVSQRAAAMLREELEMMGPVRLSDVENAQRAMIERALQLEAEGQIRIEREGSNDFV